MKVKLSNIDPRAIASARGKFYIRDTMWGPVAQLWPRPGSQPGNELQNQYRTRFAFAARMASSPEPREYQTAEYLSQGTEQVPRDLLTGAALGTFYEIYWPTGQQWARVTSPLAYTRKEVPMASWEWANWDIAWTTTMDTNASATKGTVITPFFNDKIYSTRVIFTTVDSATYQVSAGYTDASNIIQSITKSAVQIAVGSTLQCMQFDLQYTFVANQKNFLLLTRTDLTSTYALPININQTKRWHYPCINIGTCRLASNNPGIGNTLTIVSNLNASPFAFRVNQ